MFKKRQNNKHAIQLTGIGGGGGGGGPPCKTFSKYA
jgi:hypothetical protein